jgi:D-alanine-D-alanine ligase
MRMKTKVAVIMGGFSSEYEISLKSGHTVMDNLPRDKYEVFAVHIRKDDWVLVLDNKEYRIDKNDFSASVNGKKILFDVVFNAIHGTPGEDGAILPYFEILGIPHTSAAFDKMALTFNKKNTIAVLRSYGIPTAKSVFLHYKDQINIDEIITKTGLPCFVKPNRAGSSYGISKVYTKEEMLPAINKAFKEDKEIIIEAFLDGRELSVGVIKYQGNIKVLPLTEIISENDFFDFEAKYLGKSQEITPADLPTEITAKVVEIAAKVYEVLDLDGISRAEYILVNGIPHFLEINMVPGLTEASIFPQQAVAAGISLCDLFVNAVEMALKKNY